MSQGPFKTNRESRFTHPYASLVGLFSEFKHGRLPSILQPEIPQALPSRPPHTLSGIKWPGAHRTHNSLTCRTHLAAAGPPGASVCRCANRGAGGRCLLCARQTWSWRGHHGSSVTRASSSRGQSPTGLHGTPRATEVRAAPVLGCKTFTSLIHFQVFPSRDSENKHSPL